MSCDPQEEDFVIILLIMVSMILQSLFASLALAKGLVPAVLLTCREAAQLPRRIWTCLMLRSQEGVKVSGLSTSRALREHFA